MFKQLSRTSSISSRTMLSVYRCTVATQTQTVATFGTDQERVHACVRLFRQIMACMISLCVVSHADHSRLLKYIRSRYNDFSYMTNGIVISIAILLLN